MWGQRKQLSCRYIGQAVGGGGALATLLVINHECVVAVVDSDVHPGPQLKGLKEGP